jgi:hypothetical protein
MVMDALVSFKRVTSTLGLKPVVMTVVTAVVITVGAGVIAAGVGAVVAWVVVGPYGDPVHPAINTANRIAAPRIGNLVRNMSMLIGIPHDMIYSVG